MFFCNYYIHIFIIRCCQNIYLASFYDLPVYIRQIIPISNKFNNRHTEEEEEEEVEEGGWSKYPRRLDAIREANAPFEAMGHRGSVGSNRW